MKDKKCETGYVSERKVSTFRGGMPRAAKLRLGHRSINITHRPYAPVELKARQKYPRG